MIDQFINYRKYFIIAGSLLSSLVLAFLILFNVILSWDISCTNPDAILVIPEGATVNAVCDSLILKMCDLDKNVFKAGLYLQGKSRGIFSGKYPLKGIHDVGGLTKLITAPSGERIKVTILEGWELERIIDELNLYLEIDPYKFRQTCYDHNFMSTLNIQAPSLEGFLFPDTYYFFTSYLEEDIIRTMVNQFNYHYNKSVKYFAGQRGMSKLETTTMASIIQGEAMYEDEMKTISSVYHNRLKKDMLLQADPTVQYAIAGPNIRLYYKHLKTESAYNTYKYKGLPPGPINSPGLAALQAAVMPITTDFLYFVANGTGRHTFTRTMKEHNRAIAQIKKNRKKG